MFVAGSLHTEDGRHQEELGRAYDFLICLEETEVLQSMWQVLLDKQVHAGVPKRQNLQKDVI